MGVLNPEDSPELILVHLYEAHLRVPAGGLFRQQSFNNLKRCLNLVAECTLSRIQHRSVGMLVTEDNHPQLVGSHFR